MRGLERVAADRRAAIARQVRCSTGFTYGVAVNGEARIAAVGFGAPARLVAREAAKMPVDLPDRLLAWLEAREPHRHLPREAVLMERLQVADTAEGAGWMAAAWARLEKRAAVRLVRGRPGWFAGEWLVRLIVRDTVLRTAGAPVVWGEVRR
jgi:hypothetical protein